MWIPIQPGVKEKTETTSPICSTPDMARLTARIARLQAEVREYRYYDDEEFSNDDAGIDKWNAHVQRKRAARAAVDKNKDLETGSS